MSTHISLRRVAAASSDHGPSVPPGTLDYGGIVQILPPDVDAAPLGAAFHVASGLVQGQRSDGAAQTVLRHFCPDGGDGCQDCRTPHCIHETDPQLPEAPWFDRGIVIPKDATVTNADGYDYLARRDAPGTRIPLFDSADGSDLNPLLSRYRSALGHTDCAVFHVYRIADAPSLPALAGKWLAIPVAPAPGST